MEVRQVTTKDVDQWAGLLALTFDRTIGDMKKLWAWLNSGYQVFAWGAWDGDRLVAQYSCLQSTILLPHCKEPRSIGISTNMAVHPDYRGTGLIKAVSQPVYESLLAAGAVAGIGFSNSEGVKVDRHSKSYGYQVVGRLAIKLMWPLPRLDHKEITFSGTWPESRWVDTSQSKASIRFNSTPQMIHHRYALHPFRTYRFGFWQEHDEIRGLVVDRPAYVGSVKGVSLLAAYGDNLNEVLRRWIAGVKSQDAKFIHFIATPFSSILASLKSIGTCWTLPYSRSPHYLTVKPLCEELRPLLTSFNHWDCIGGNIL